MKKAKRKQRFFIAAALIASMMIQPFAAFATDNAPGQLTASDDSVTVLWDEDFDSTDKSHEPFSRSSNTEITKYDDAHGKSAKISCLEGTWPEFVKVFDEPIDDGVLYVGYDILRTEAKGRTYDGFGEADYSTWNNGLYVGTMWNGVTGNISYYKNCDIEAIKTALPAGLIPKVGEWHRIESYFDFDNRTVTYFVDGEFLGQTGMTDSMKQIKMYRRSCQPEYGKADQYFDNFKILHIKDAGNIPNIDDSMAMPEYLKAPVMLSLDTEITGNAFFDDTANIKLNAKNNSLTDISGNAKIVVYNDNGNKVYDNTQKCEIKPHETVELSYDLALDTIGYYNVSAEFIPTDAKSSTTETSIVRVQKAQKQNESLGYSAHSYWGYGTEYLDDKLNILSNAGFSQAREQYFWVYMKRDNGKFEFDEKYQQLNTALDKSNIEPFVNMTSAAVIDGILPRNQEELNAYYNYVYNTVSMLKGKAEYYEVENETHTIGKGKEYVAMQKAAYEAAKAADPSCKVLCGATARVPEDWIKELLDNGAGEYFDGFSCHPYTVENVPEQGRQKEGTALDMVRLLRRLLDEHGLKDKSIVISELSYSSGKGYATDEQQAEYGMRQYLMIRDDVETFIWYNDQDKAADESLEGNFGLLKHWSEVAVPYQPKPILLAMSNFNNIIGEGKCASKWNDDDKEVYAYQYKNIDGTKDVAAIWDAKNNRKSVSVDLGCDSADLYDMYGNSRKIYTYNGKFNIDISESITYLVGNFSKCEIGESDFYIKDFEKDVIAGENFNVMMNLPNTDNITVKSETPDNVQESLNTNDEIVFSCGGDNKENENVKINVYAGDKLVYSHRIDLTYVHPIAYTGQLVSYNTQRYQMNIELKNERNSDVSVKVRLTEPESLSRTVYTIDTINPKNKRTIKTNIPIADADSNTVTIKGVIEEIYDGGSSEVPLEITKEVGSLKYGDKKPTIDGEISDGEWYEFLPMRINKKEMAQQKVWGGVDDLGANVYTMCDDENFYMAVDVTDDVYYDNTTPDKIWSVDSVQFAIALKRQNGSPSTEIGFGIANGEPTVQCYLAQAIDGGKAVDTGTVLANTKYAVKRYEDKKKTIYEIQVPWSDIYGEKVYVNTLSSIYFSILVNDNDGVSRGWLEYCGGIGTNKNPELFMELPIYKVK